MRFLMIAALMALTPTFAQAGGFTPELFQTWIKMRGGENGKPVYWYTTGTILRDDDGTPLSTMEGFDTALMVRDTTKPNSWIQLSRKIFVSLDLKTGEVLKDKEGNPRKPIAYPFQVKTYTLDGDDIVYTVESHDGGAVYSEPAKRNYTATQIGKVVHYNYAMFLDRVRPDGTRVKRFEVNDFFYRPEKSLSEQERYQYTWTGTGPGPIVSSAVSWRYSKLDDMPKRIVDYVRANAPLWVAPPKDMAEIEGLRKITPYVRQN